ncbi:MAG: FHA domain-containing protein [Bacteriovoracaceae bacterium]|jgi:tetratricopeptide (TPR) repeat protein|nr:FHA domain-containing protein [Bacteriovoracaceae bacterium]
MSKKNVIILKHYEAPKEAGTYYRLVCLNGENKGYAYFLVSKRSVMGRSDNADIRVLDIKSSREHAEIVRTSNNIIITDLGSHNGLVVNDLKIKQHVLEDGDKIIIGQTIYRFSKLSVAAKVETKQETQELESFENNSEQEVTKQKNSRKKIIIGAILFAIMLMLFSSEEEKTTIAKRKKELNNSSAGIISVNAKRQKKQDKERQKKMAVYFARGLREFREGNYFRAMSEFEHALSWNPNDSLALFYMRKTKDALNKTVEELFNKARRDEDSIKLKSAVVSYCGIIRLLYRYPNDDRYKDAKEKIKGIEEKLGMEEGEFECLQEIK